MPDVAFTIRYWGTTGSIARPLSPDEVTDKIATALQAIRDRELWNAWMASPCTHDAAVDFLRRHLPASLHSTTGGNSTCIEIEAGDELLLVDAGSGLRVWSNSMQSRRILAELPEDCPLHAHLLLTHAHLDHLVGISACDVLFQPHNEITVWASASVIHRLHELLHRSDQQRSPLSGVTLRHLVSIRNWNVLEHNAIVRIGDTQVQAFACNHPGESLAYRFDRDGCAFVIATDHEQVAAPDEGLAQFAAEADLVYFDAQYTRAEYEGHDGIGGGRAQPRRGWGHSTVEACIETALRARCRRLHLGHHEPQRDDAGLEAIELLARNYLAARLAAGRVELPAAPPQAADEPDAPPLEISLAREGTSLSLPSNDLPGTSPCHAD